MTSSGKAVQIVRMDKKTKGLELDIDALAEICLNEKCRDRPVCVVSIAGDFRKGKSFMLNFFLRYLYNTSNKQQQASITQQSGEHNHQTNNDWMGKPNDELKGFSWRGGSRPETTGILIWSEPIVVKKANGQEVAVLLMDTQGAFDSRQTIGQTAIIFALSTLTSSIQIYNVMNNIQEDNLQILDTFLAYGQLVLDKSTEKPFQTLCFLVRDWRSPSDYAYGAYGGEGLLNEKLALDEEEPDSSDNKTRKRIESCFERKCCFLMPYPGERVSVEEGGEFKGQIVDMKENFVDNIKAFVPSVLSPDKLLIKRIGGQEVNGKGLLEYFKVYAETFKGEKIPEAKTLYDATAEASNLATVANCKSFYLDSMKDVCGANKPYINPEILDKKHEELSRKSIEMFNKTKKLGDKDYSQSFLSNLEKDLAASYSEFAESNKSKNMFKMWGTPLILMCLWLIALTVSRVLELIGLYPIANLISMTGTLCVFVTIFYLSIKYAGNFPEVVVAIDHVAEMGCKHVMDLAMQQAVNRIQPS